MASQSQALPGPFPIFHGRPCARVIVQGVERYALCLQATTPLLVDIRRLGWTVGGGRQGDLDWVGSLITNDSFASPQTHLAAPLYKTMDIPGSTCAHVCCSRGCNFGTNEYGVCRTRFIFARLIRSMTDRIWLYSIRSTKVVWSTRSPGKMTGKLTN